MLKPAPPLSLESAQDLKDALFVVMTDGVLVIDRHGTIVDCNPAFHHQLGYSKHEILGTTIAALDPPEFAAKVPQRLEQILSDGHATFETAHRRKDGSIMPVELNARYFEADGQLYFFSIVRDITERKWLEEQLQEGIQVYQAAINTPALGFWVVDLRGRFLEVNDAYLRQSGYSREELLEMTIPDVEALERPEETHDHLERLTRDGFDRFRSEHRRKDGSLWPVEIVTTYSEVLGGRMFVFIEDITEKLDQASRLELAARVFETMDQAVVVTDAENRIVSINPAASRITGYSADEVRGHDPKLFASGRHDQRFYQELWDTLQASDHWEGEIWDRRKDGVVYAKWLTINAIRDDLGNVHQYVSVFSDITARKKTEQLIWKQANFDSLTGLPNRYLLRERLDQELKKAQRNNNQVAVLFIDLDRFKEVNDSLGHAKGDALLIQAARRIAARVRNTDTIARLGGDEFTVVLPDYGHRCDLERVAQSLIDTLGEPYDLGEAESAYVSASIGITIYPDDDRSLDGLLKQADQAMYVAKADGRNRFGYFTASMQEEARDKLVLSNDLRHALPRGELEVYYQPIVNLDSGTIVKAEALLRWHHPQRGMVSPAEFIPLAEDSGLIHDIGQWVFTQTIATVKRWQERFGRIVQISVNKSPLQFEKTIQPTWTELLTQLGLPGNSITVEITESSLLSKSQRIKERLLEFRNAGIEVSIDDFGTGFSALSYLHQFDIDYLKIDRSFVSHLEEDDAGTALTEAIVVMAHKLGIKAIAEGVETERQRDMLRAFGCDYAQGYLYSRPVDVTTFEKLLATAGAADSNEPDPGSA